MKDPTEIEHVMRLAYELADDGRTTEAEAAFLSAAGLVPTWSVPWYELGLLCKYQGRWTESLAYNSRAAEYDPADEASWWNTGIAATAVGDWPAARRAWAKCGIRLPDGDGPPDMDLGLVPVRLDAEDAGEVVWARRMDPARARIVNVPLPTTRYRWGDIVLHDGAPEGHRILDGREVPVFNVLDRLAPSGFETFVAELASVDAAAVALLESIAERHEGAAEHWGTSTNILCRACSFGTPHEHDHAAGPPAHPHCGIAARDEHHAGRIIDDWLAEAPGADLVRWYAADVAS